MHFPRIFLAVIASAILFAALQPQSGLAQTSCPAGQRESTDLRGSKWCIDSEGRSFKLDPVQTNASNLPKKQASSASRPTNAPSVTGMPREPFQEYSSSDKPLSGEDLKLYKFMGERRAIDASKERQLGQDSDEAVKDDSPYLECAKASAHQVSRENSYRYGVLAYRLKNRNEVTCWMQRSSELGYAKATGFIGVGYFTGDISERNPDLAFKYLSAAAQGGDTSGIYFLGLCYGSGFGVAEDMDRFWDLRGQALAKPDGVAVVGEIEAESFKKAVAEDERKRHQDDFDPSLGACRAADGQRIRCAHR